MMINYKVRNSYSQLIIPQQHLSSSSSFNQNTTSRNISSTLRMVAASLYLPKDDESNPRGEDAHFICSNQQTIGVADGVGGWAATNTGISGGNYARELMANCVKSLVGSVDHVDPERVLNEAYSNTHVQGSSTACIISLIQDGGNNKNILRVYNVGDSGFILIREGKCVYKSQTQQRGFNCPYQLGITSDSPRCGEKTEVEVREGDLVIAGTDGLFDNMHIWEIEEMVNRRTAALSRDVVVGEDHRTLLEKMACEIANLALYNSFDRFADTPYARAARNAGRKHKGGKVDDITVIIACIR